MNLAGGADRALEEGEPIALDCNGPIRVGQGLTARQVAVILAGGLINWRKTSDLTVSGEHGI